MAIGYDDWLQKFAHIDMIVGCVTVYRLPTTCPSFFVNFAADSCIARKLGLCWCSLLFWCRFCPFLAFVWLGGTACQSVSHTHSNIHASSRRLLIDLAESSNDACLSVRSECGKTNDIWLQHATDAVKLWYQPEQCRAVQQATDMLTMMPLALLPKAFALVIYSDLVMVAFGLPMNSLIMSKGNATSPAPQKIMNSNQPAVFTMVPKSIIFLWTALPREVSLYWIVLTQKVHCSQSAEICSQVCCPYNKDVGILSLLTLRNCYSDTCQLEHWVDVAQDLPDQVDWVLCVAIWMVDVQTVESKPRLSFACRAMSNFCPWWTGEVKMPYPSIAAARATDSNMPLYTSVLCVASAWLLDCCCKQWFAIIHCSTALFACCVCDSGLIAALQCICFWALVFGSSWVDQTEETVSPDFTVSSVWFAVTSSSNVRLHAASQWGCKQQTPRYSTSAELQPADFLMRLEHALCMSGLNQCCHLRTTSSCTIADDEECSTLLATLDMHLNNEAFDIASDCPEPRLLLCIANASALFANHKKLHTYCGDYGNDVHHERDPDFPCVGGQPTIDGITLQQTFAAKDIKGRWTANKKDCLMQDQNDYLMRLGMAEEAMQGAFASCWCWQAR